MSIQIIVNDPANTSRADLRLVIALLQRFEGSNAAETIAAPDLPSVGAINGDDAADAFQGGALPAEAAFGGAGSATPEQAFAGSAPLVPNAALPPAGAAPSMPTNGAPPAPSNGAATAGAVTLDKAGLPWDARIHAKNSKGPGGVTVADGTWRKKAKVDPALVVQVEAELRALMAAPVPGVPRGYVEPAVPVMPHGGGAAALPNAAPPPPATPASPSAAGTSSPASAPSAAATSYAEFIQRCGPAMAAQKLSLAEINAECAKFGVADMSLLPQRMDLFPFVAEGVQAILNARG